METTEFQVDSCITVVATYAKKLGLHFGEELPTEREFGNLVYRYNLSVKKDSSNYVPSGFENSLRIDPARYVANIPSNNIARRPPRGTQNLMKRIKSRDKIAMDLNVANSVRCENKVLTLKNRYTVF